LEVSRLASLSVKENENSPLGFINRVTEATFTTTDVVSNKVSVFLEIEWGNGEVTKNLYLLFVGSGE
jgi:hypothetical protein